MAEPLPVGELPKARVTPAFSDKHSVGLVLSGGGAKGAYEIGCWKALTAFGITRFKAVSGTSIGGINAFLVCCGNLEDAERIWDEMGQKTPLPVSLPRIALAFIERYGLAFCFAIHALIVSLPVLLGVMAIGAVLLMLGEVLHPWYAVALPTAILTAVAIVRYIPASRNRRYTAFPFTLRSMKRYLRQELPIEHAALFGAAGLAIPPGLLIYDIAKGASPWWLLLGLLCFALAVAAIVILAELGSSSFGELSFLSSEALEALLQRQLEALERMPSEPALYITRLREDTVTVPGRIPSQVDATTQAIIRSIAPEKTREDLTIDELESIRQRQSDLGLNNPLFGNSIEEVIGLEYVPLAGRPTMEVADCLISTSAMAGVLARGRERLPQNLESYKVIRGLRAEFYDAGLTDNTPVAPLLEHEQCDILIVVFLDHGIRPETARSLLAANLGRINERIRHLNQDLDAATWQRLKQSRTLTPIRDAASRLAQVELISIIPSEELGSGFSGFVRETARFRSERVRHLMKLGFDDTKHALEAFFAQREDVVSSR